MHIQPLQDLVIGYSHQHDVVGISLRIREINEQHCSGPSEKPSELGVVHVLKFLDSASVAFGIQRSRTYCLRRDRVFSLLEGHSKRET